jgi:hypothetical protein
MERNREAGKQKRERKRGRERKRDIDGGLGFQQRAI